MPWKTPLAADDFAHVERGKLTAQAVRAELVEAARPTRLRYQQGIVTEVAPLGTAGPANEVLVVPRHADSQHPALHRDRPLVWFFHGEGIDCFGGAASAHLENVIWIAAEMVDAAVELHQRCAGERAVRT